MRPPSNLERSPATVHLQQHSPRVEPSCSQHEQPQPTHEPSEAGEPRGIRETHGVRKRKPWWRHRFAEATRALLLQRVSRLLWRPFKGLLQGVVRGVLVNVAGCAVGLAASLSAGVLLMEKRRTLTVDEPEVRRILTVTDEAHLQRLRASMPAWVRDPSLEPARWLNNVIGRFWPVLNPTLSRVFVDKLWPKFCRRKSIPEGLISLESFSLGAFPPTVEYVRSISCHDPSAIVEFRVHLATNANACGTLTLVRASGSSKVADDADNGNANLQRTSPPTHLTGFHSPLQLSHFIGTALVRVTFDRLAPRFPCCQAVRVAVVGEPEFDFSLSTLAGIDLMSLPFASSRLRAKLQASIARRMLWPQRLTAWADRKDKNKPDEPRRAIGTVAVEVVAARGLLQHGILWQQNIMCPSPYVRAFVAPSHPSQTSPCPFTCDPVWREVMRLPVTDPEADAVTLEVVDSSAVWCDKLIGSCVFSVSLLKQNETQNFTLGLWTTRGAPCGELEFLATWRVLHSDTLPRPIGPLDSARLTPGVTPRMAPVIAHVPGLVEVTVRRGLDLDMGGWLGASHDGIQFVCRMFLAGEKRQSTAVQARGNPQWDETFEFLLDRPPLNASLLIEVLSQQAESMLLGTTELRVGTVEVPLLDVLHNKRIVDVFQLHQTKQGYLKLELRWRPLQ